MSFFQNLSDNNAAVLGCAGLLLTAFTLMSVSYHIGVIVRGGRTTATRTTQRLRGVEIAAETPETRRRAA
ncbi:MAG: hypothetical protein U0992_12570 [Planctomycetaceae bacterium]